MFLVMIMNILLNAHALRNNFIALSVTNLKESPQFRRYRSLSEIEFLERRINNLQTIRRCKILASD